MIRVLMNLPANLPRGFDRMVVVDVMPRVGEQVMVDNHVYGVVRVLHPVVVLQGGRDDLTPIEEAHKDPSVSVVPD